MNDQEKIQALVFRCLDETPDSPVTAGELEELEALIRESPENEAFYLELLEQESLLRGERQDLNVAQATLQRIQQGLDKRLQNGVIKGVQKKSVGKKRKRRFITIASSAAALLLLAAGVYWLYLFGTDASAQQAYLYGQKYVTPGQTAFYRIFVENGRTGRPIPSAGISSVLVDSRNNIQWSLDTRADSQGMAHLSVAPESGFPEGAYSLRTTITSPQGRCIIRKRIASRNNDHIKLVTDKPIYQPGQTIHLKALVRDMATQKPREGKKLNLIIRNPAGLMIYQKPLTTSRFGIAAASCPLAGLIKEGTYTISCLHKNRTIAGFPIKIQTYKLPVMQVTLTTGQSSYLRGQSVTGRVSARYFFKKPVTGGKVQLSIVSSSDPDDAITFTEKILDDHGEHHFALTLPEYLPFVAPRTSKVSAVLQAIITDTAGHKEQASMPLLITRSPHKPSSEVDQKESLFVLSTNHDVYQSGGAVNLEVSAPESIHRIWVDIIQRNRTYLMTSMPLTRGKGRIQFNLPPRLAGTAGIHAYQVTPEDRIIGGKASIFIEKEDDIDVATRFDRDSYKPGETATLQLSVTRKGEPIQTALGVSMVDQAVSAVMDSFSSMGNTRLNEISLAGAPVLKRSKTWPEKQAVLAWKRQHALEQFKTALTILPALAFAIFLAWVILAINPVWIAQTQGHRPLASNEESTGTLYPVMLLCFLLWIAWFFLLLFIEHIPFEALTIASLFFCTAIFFTELEVKLHRDRFDAVTLKWFRLLPLILLAQTLCLIYMNYSNPLDWHLPLHDKLNKLRVGLTIFIISTSLYLIGVIFELLFSRYLSGKRFRAAFMVKLGFAFILLTLAAGFLTPTVMSGGGGGGGGSEETGPFYPSNRIIQADYTSTHSGRTTTPKKPVHIRRFFPETLLWHPELITDHEGKATVEVPLADSITTWDLAVDGITQQGFSGKSETPLTVFQDFFVDIDVPAQLTQNDRIAVPIRLHNYLDETQTVQVAIVPAAWFRCLEAPQQTLNIPPDKVLACHFPIEVLKPGRHALTVMASGSRLSDAIERPVSVRPDGHEVIRIVNGRLTRAHSETVIIPDTAIDDASRFTIKLYPGMLGKVAEGLENIFRMPHGCFEQSSSITYPNMLTLQYLKATGQVKPAMEEKARRYIQEGYQRLLSFETETGGFDWFGRSPGKIVLTAYALMQLADMSRLQPIDQRVLARTRRWLLNQQWIQGDWRPDTKDMTRGGSLATTAYIAWALLLTIDNPEEYHVQNGLNFIINRVGKTDDPYTLAMCANALNAANNPAVRTVCDKLASMIRTDQDTAYWSSASRGVTLTSGRALSIETTALITHAFLQHDYRRDITGRTLAWLTRNMDRRGTWYNTQTTVQVLRALLAGGAQYSTGVTKETPLAIALNGETIKTLMLKPEENELYHVFHIEDGINKGANIVTLSCPEKTGIAYQLIAAHYEPDPAPPTSGVKQLSITSLCKKTTLKKGDIMPCQVSVCYKGPGAGDMPIIDLQLPPGFQAMAGDFDRLVEKRLIERYTLSDHQVILYIRQLPDNQPLELNYRLIPKTAAQVKMPAAKAYLYYEPEVCGLSQPVDIIVQ